MTVRDAARRAAVHRPHRAGHRRQGDDRRPAAAVTRIATRSPSTWTTRCSPRSPSSRPTASPRAAEFAAALMGRDPGPAVHTKTSSAGRDPERPPRRSLWRPRSRGNTRPRGHPQRLGPASCRCGRRPRRSRGSPSSRGQGSEVAYPVGNIATYWRCHPMGSRWSTQRGTAGPAGCSTSAASTSSTPAPCRGPWADPPGVLARWAMDRLRRRRRQPEKGSLPTEAGSARLLRWTPAASTASPGSRTRRSSSPD